MVNMHLSYLLDRLSNNHEKTRCFSKKYEIGIFEEKPQIEYIEHAHDFSEIAIVKSGSAMHFIDGRAHHISRGNIILINSPDVHHTFSSNKNLDIVNIVYNDDSIETNSLIKSLNNNTLMHSGLFTLDNTSLNLTLQIIEKLHSEIKSSDSFSKLYIESSITQLFIEMFRSKRYNPDLKIDSKDNIPHYIINYINDNLDEDINWDEISHNFEISTRTLSRIINSHTGYSPQQLLVMSRMCNATHLLSNTDKAVIDISLECGFQDSNHFSSSFKKQFGMSPSDYRKLHYR